MRRLALLLPSLTLTLLVAAGCPGEGPVSLGERPNLTVQVLGRVVDFETCMSQAGCQGVPDLRVSLFQDSRVISDKTRPDGAFTLRSVPNGVSSHLLATDSSSGAAYLSSLQATPVVTKSADVFGVEIFALKREGGLYEAFAKEAAVDVGTNALYLGQVYYLDSGKMKALEGATGRSTPAATVRYVNCNPRFKTPTSPCPLALFETIRTTTGPFGEFIVAAPSAGKLAVVVTALDRSFPELSATVGTGYITVGLHAAQGVAGDAGPTKDSGSAKDRSSAKDKPSVGKDVK